MVLVLLRMCFVRCNDASPLSIKLNAAFQCFRASSSSFRLSPLVDEALVVMLNAFE